MKKSFLLVFAAAGVLAACNNAETDTRIAQLDQRVTALEENKSVANAHDHAAHDATAQNNAQFVSDSEADGSIAKVDGPTAKIEYQKAEYDFGTVKEGAVVEHTFTFKNIGSVPLVIQNASATCGCTVPKKPEKPIAPGETGEIQVRFDSSNKPGIQNKVVTITANTDPAISRLTIKGTVEPKAAAAAANTEGPVRN